MRVSFVATLKAIRAASYSAVRVLIDKAGRIEIATEGEAQREPDEMTPLQQWKATRGQS